MGVPARDPGDAPGSGGHGSNPAAGGGPGLAVLYFDPNPTTARLATAGLRLAGYLVYGAASEDEAVTLCRAHGPAGDGSIVALLLDAATSPAVSASVLRALVQVPGAAELPGILLVSRSNPTPIPGAEGLPAVKRPFTTPALLKVLREAVDAAPTPVRAGRLPEELLARLRLALGEHFPEIQLPDDRLRSFASTLVAQAELPTLGAAVAVVADLSAVRLESVLGMLDREGARGVVQIHHENAWARLHVDRGRIRMAEVDAANEDHQVGRFVVAAGFMTGEALDAVAGAEDPEHRPLASRLVEDGHLRTGELARVLLNQARDITCTLLTWRRGRVTFTPSEELHPLAVTAAQSRAQLMIGEALLEGLRRLDEAAEMGPNMAGLDDVFVRVDAEIAKVGRNAFTREELDVLELLNGRNSVKEIARRTRTGTFSVARVLYRLGRANLARRRTMPVQV